MFGGDTLEDYIQYINGQFPWLLIFAQTIIDRARELNAECIARLNLQRSLPSDTRRKDCEKSGASLDRVDA